MVTVFPNSREVNNCYNITLGQWLNGCMKPSKETLPNLIKQIRATDDKAKKSELKIKLPGVVLGAVVRSRAKNDNSKVMQLTGLLPFDIDQQDNPGMDAAAVRNVLSKVRNVIFAALSASGKGVWGLVQVSNPSKQKEHFEQLKSDFEKLGIIIDKSKGGNPTDLRFYSYDPEAYLSETFKIYDRTPKPQQSKPVKVKHSKQAFSINPIQKAVDLVQASTDGEKHNSLLKAARLLGGYVATGTILEHEAQTALENAIRTKSIVSFSDAQKTIADGIKNGKQEPIYAPNQEPKQQPFTFECEILPEPPKAAAPPISKATGRLAAIEDLFIKDRTIKNRHAIVVKLDQLKRGTPTPQQIDELEKYITQSKPLKVERPACLPRSLQW